MGCRCLTDIPAPDSGARFHRERRHAAEEYLPKMFNDIKHSAGSAGCPDIDVQAICVRRPISDQPAEPAD
jgi:hypothetical protein